MNDDLIMTPVPALVAVLLAREKAKGSPLTQNEVGEITDEVGRVWVASQKSNRSTGWTVIRVWECFVARTFRTHFEAHYSRSQALGPPSGGVSIRRCLPDH